ncbi:proline-rich protein 36-like [Lutra lutra]|uniref:proline-rich protein 36-like n=1 Tax=Lutra lutra TaxID=9657 RepID=UPI001FD0F210|nr:proline-rich protein 36-like [Lutra lutra]
MARSGRREMRPAGEGRAVSGAACTPALRSEMAHASRSVPGGLGPSPNPLKTMFLFMRLKAPLPAATQRLPTQMKPHHLPEHLATESPHQGQHQHHGQPVHPEDLRVKDDNLGGEGGTKLLGGSEPPGPHCNGGIRSDWLSPPTAAPPPRPQALDSFWAGRATGEGSGAPKVRRLDRGHHSPPPASRTLRALNPPPGPKSSSPAAQPRAPLFAPPNPAPSPAASLTDPPATALHKPPRGPNPSPSRRRGPQAPILAPDRAAPADDSAPQLRADRHPGTAPPPAPSRRRPGALTSEPPRRDRAGATQNPARSYNGAERKEELGGRQEALEAEASPPLPVALARLDSLAIYAFNIAGFVGARVRRHLPSAAGLRPGVRGGQGRPGGAQEALGAAGWAEAEPGLPEAAAGQRRRDSPRTDFSLVPYPPPTPPERQLLRRQMRRLNPSSWSLRRANRLEPIVGIDHDGGKTAAMIIALLVEQPPGSLRSPPPPPQSAVFVFIAVRAPVALLPKGIVSLTPAFRTPHTCSRHEPRLAARGRERPGSREPPWDRGTGRLPALSEAPPLSEPPSPSLRLPEPPSDLKTPSLHTNPEPRSQAPKAPGPARRGSPLPCPLSWLPVLGAGRAGGLRAGGWSPPAAHRSLGNAGKARAMLALPAGTQRRRGSPGGATAGEGGHRQQAGLAAPDPIMGSGHAGFPASPTTSPLGSSAKPTAPLGKPAQEHFGDRA